MPSGGAIDEVGACLPRSSLSGGLLGMSNLQALLNGANRLPVSGRLCVFAQAMRASLLAKATAATLRWVRDVSWASHALRPEDCFAPCCRTARAPCTKPRLPETG